MRFKLDENIPLAAISLLSEHHHDALSVLDQNMGGADDRTLVEVCTSENRTLLTSDTDFANLVTYPPQEHAGVVVFRLKKQDKLNFLKILKKLLHLVSEESPEKQLWIVDEDRIRIRS